MNDRELFQHEKQAILDDYEEKLKELKEMASVSNTNDNTDLDKQIKTVESKIKDAKVKLAAVGKASDEEIESHKKDIDDSFKTIYTHLAMS